MNIREFFRKSQFPILIGLGTYPVAACAAAYFALDLLSLAWIFPVVYAALAILALLLPTKPRWILGVFGVVLLVAPCVLYLPITVMGTALVIAVMYSVLLFWSLQFSAWEPSRELGAGSIGIGLAINLVSYVLTFFEPGLAPAALQIKAALFFFVLLAMLSMNRGSLNLASGESRGFTAVMRRKNLFLTMGMFGIALLFALIPSLSKLVAAIFAWITQLIAWLRNMLASMVPEETTVETTVAVTIAPTVAEGWMDAVLDGKEVYRHSESVNVMMTAIVLVVMIPVSLAVLYGISKLLVHGVRRLAALISRAANAQTEDFVDEITDTRENARYARSSEKRPHRRVQVLGKMPPAERIRYHYRRLLSKHPQWQDHHTARENLAEEAAVLYERARYSDHPVTDLDAERFQKETK